MDNKNIGVIGIGRLGLSFALLCAKQGYVVCGCDSRKDYAMSLMSPSFTSPEPFIRDYLLECANFCPIFNTEMVLERCDILFCFVATPSLSDGSYDHSAVDDVVNQLQELHVCGMDMTGKILV